MACCELDEAEDTIEELEEQVDMLEKEKAELIDNIDSDTFTDDDIKQISESIYHCDLDLKKLIQEIGIDLIKKTLATF